MEKQKGFTIIELIVVIVIIAVMAAIVLVNVTKYTTSGKNAAIKGNLATLVTRGIKYFEDSSLGNGSYNAFCGSATGGSPIKAAITNDGGTVSATWCTCNDAANTCADSTATKWCACASEIASSATTFCVDSSGYKKETATACSTRCTAGICGD